MEFNNKHFPFCFHGLHRHMFLQLQLLFFYIQQQIFYDLIENSNKFQFTIFNENVIQQKNLLTHFSSLTLTKYIRKNNSRPLSQMPTVIGTKVFLCKKISKFAMNSVQVQPAHFGWCSSKLIWHIVGNAEKSSKNFIEKQKIWM